MPSKARSDDRYELILKLQNVAAVARLLQHQRHRRPGRTSRTSSTAPGADAGPDLAAVRQQVPQAPRLRLQAPPPSAVSTFLNRQEREFPRAVPARQAEPDPVAELVRPERRYDIANRPDQGLLKTGQGTKARNPRPVRPGDQRRRADRDLRTPPRPAAPVQVLVPAARRPLWQVHGRPAGLEDQAPDTLRSSLSLFMRDLDAYDRKLGTG